VSPLISLGIYNRAEAAPPPILRVSGAGPRALLLELEKRQSHRMSQAMLRRAIEISELDDAARIKAISEDTDRRRRIVETFTNSLLTHVPAETQSVGTVSTAKVEREPAQYGFDALISHCMDITIRPYFESAQTVYQLETISLAAALSNVTLLPPSLEHVGPLISLSIFDRAQAAPAPILCARVAGPHALLLELEKRQSHRMAQAWLRRAIDLSAMDDVARIKAISEDRDRWRRTVETVTTSAKSLEAKLSALMGCWRDNDPSCPALPYIEAARLELTKTRPASEDEISRALTTSLAPVAGRPTLNQTPPTPESSSWALRNELEALARLSESVTGNPIPSIFLQRGLATLKGSGSVITNDVA